MFARGREDREAGESGCENRADRSVAQAAAGGSVCVRNRSQAAAIAAFERDRSGRMAGGINDFRGRGRGFDEF